MAVSVFFDRIEATSAFTPVTIILAVVATALFSVTAYAAIRPAFDKNAPKQTTDSLPLIGSWNFFPKRWEFFRDSAARSSTGNFSYYLGKHQVIGVSGEEARKWYFDSRDLNFNAGYDVLFGQGPQTNEYVEDESGKTFGTYFTRRLVPLLKTDCLVKRMPYLVSDIRKGLDEFDSQPGNVTNPYDSMYKIIFALTLRMVGADEIADDRKLMEKSLYYYEMVESTSTAWTVIAPYLPSFAHLKRVWAGSGLYMMFKNVVDARKKEGRREEDPLQYLIDQGDSVANMITFVVGALFAGLINSGINASAILAFLGENPEWQERALAEVKAVADKYGKDPKASLVEKLDDVPLEAWESQFPLMDLCLKESIRINTAGTTFRRNVSNKPLAIPGSKEIVPPGAFVTYHVSDLHHNDEVYPDALKWDPNRYLAGRNEDKKQHYGWMGWGLGRHPCLGMRFAKLEMNMVLAYVIGMYDWEHIDKDGNATKGLPVPNLNNHSAGKPKTPVFLRYTRRNI